MLSLSPSLSHSLSIYMPDRSRDSFHICHKSTKLMCRRRRGDALASLPLPRISTAQSPRSRSSGVVSFPVEVQSTINTSSSSSSSSSSRSASSLASLRSSLPENPILFSFSEIAAATNNFLSKRISPSSSSSWRCSLRGNDAVVFQRLFHGGDRTALPSRLAAVCQSHHRCLVRLLGASLTADRIYLVYDFVPGASLADCLRNPRNPNFTPLSSWISRIQIASDIAQGIDYIHHHAASRGIIHNRIKSSAVIVTEDPQFNAMICHVGAAFLAGDVPEEDTDASLNSKMSRSDSRLTKIEGTIGYLAPEVVSGGAVSRRSDVFAFGVLLLELISGDEPVKHKFDRIKKEYRSSSLIEMAKHVFREEEGAELRKLRIRQWVDRRLKDSFPVEVVEKLMGISLRCVETEAGRRPTMTWVQGKISKLFLKSKDWDARVRVPTDFSVSLGPR